jgi:hypothetical protein
MNLKPILPAAALLVLLMPSQAFSKDHYDFDDVNNGAVTQTGSLTPFSNVNPNHYLTGNVDRYTNGFDPNTANLGVNQYGNYGGLTTMPYDMGANSNNYDLSNRAHMHRHHDGCNSLRSQMENAMRANGTYGSPYSNPAYANAMNNINNPAVNPYAHPMNNQYANAYANPYVNPNAAAYNGNPYANPYNPYANGYSNPNNGFINSATSSGNLSRLGSALSGSGFGTLGAYVQNGNLNGGSLSGLRGLLGI